MMLSGLSDLPSKRSAMKGAAMILVMSWMRREKPTRANTMVRAVLRKPWPGKPTSALALNPRPPPLEGLPKKMQISYY